MTVPTKSPGSAEVESLKDLVERLVAALRSAHQAPQDECGMVPSECDYPNCPKPTGNFCPVCAPDDVTPQPAEQPQAEPRLHSVGTALKTCTIEHEGQFYFYDLSHSTTQPAEQGEPVQPYEGPTLDELARMPERPEFVLVPVEPTTEMLTAACAEEDKEYGGSLLGIYRAMLAARPQATPAAANREARATGEGPTATTGRPNEAGEE